MRAKRGVQVAEKAGALKAASKMYRCGVVTVHGVATTGKWQKDLHEICQDRLIFVLHVDYGYRAPMLRAKSVAEEAGKRLSEKCHQIAKRELRVCAVGHSFGTLVIGHAFDLVPELALDRVVLSSSILGRRFEWSRIQKAGRVNQVLNEYCPADRVVPLAGLYRLLSLPAGLSGRSGFSDTCGGAVANVSYRVVGHTGLPSPDHMDKAWLPFFLRGRIPTGN